GSRPPHRSRGGRGASPPPPPCLGGGSPAVSGVLLPVMRLGTALTHWLLRPARALRGELIAGRPAPGASSGGCGHRTRALPHLHAGRGDRPAAGAAHSGHRRLGRAARPVVRRV